MNEKLKTLLKEVILAPAGETMLVFCMMLLLSVCGLINALLLNSTDGWFLPMLLVSFALPYLLFAGARGGKEYLPTAHLSLPRRCHVPTLIFGTLTLISGTLCLKLAIFEGKYTALPIYNMFFARRNGNIFNDIYLLLAFCIVPPILEGIMFRGVLLKEWDGRGRLVAAAFSSFLYALLSFGFEGFMPQLFIGAMLCIITYATDSLAVSVAIHTVYNVFAVFFEPTLISLKNVSSNFNLFLALLTPLTLLCALFFSSHLSRLYGMYSKKRFGINKTRSASREKSFWNLLTLALALPSLLAIVLFLTVAVIDVI